MALGLCSLVIRGVKISEQFQAFDMVANTHIFHPGNNATEGHSLPPPPKWGSVCWWWVGTGPLRAKFGRTEESFLSWLPVPSGTQGPLHPFALSKPVLVLFLCSPLSNQTRLCSSLWRSSPNTSQHVNISFRWFRTWLWFYSCVPTPLQFLFSKNAREWAILLWKQGDTTSGSSN